MVALFIRDDFEEVVGDEEGEEKEANFNPDEGASQMEIPIRR